MTETAQHWSDDSALTGEPCGPTKAETTQTDPAREWAEAWLEDHPDARLADVHEAVAVVYGGEVADRVALDVWHADDLEGHPNRPLTVADIPAGQGPASLCAVGDVICYRETDGSLREMMREPNRHALAQVALWDHLAATLPTVTDEEEA